MTKTITGKILAAQDALLQAVREATDLETKVYVAKNMMRKAAGFSIEKGTEEAKNEFKQIRRRTFDLELDFYMAKSAEVIAVRNLCEINEEAGNVY